MSGLGPVESNKKHKMLCWMRTACPPPARMKEDVGVNEMRGRYGCMGRNRTGRCCIKMTESKHKKSVMQCKNLTSLKECTLEMETVDSVVEIAQVIEATFGHERPHRP